MQSYILYSFIFLNIYRTHLHYMLHLTNISPILWLLSPKRTYTWRLFSIIFYSYCTKTADACFTSLEWLWMHVSLLLHESLCMPHTLIGLLCMPAARTPEHIHLILTLTLLTTFYSIKLEAHTSICSQLHQIYLWLSKNCAWSY